MSEAPQGPNHPKPPIAGEPKWVLITEDDPELSSILEEGLRSTGSFRIVRADSVVEACKKLANQKFDCILIDLRLARGSGEQVIDYCRSHPLGFNYATPILVMSAYLDAPVVQRLRALVNGILVKPFNFQSLIAKINSVIAPPSPPSP